MWILWLVNLSSLQCIANLPRDCLMLSLQNLLFCTLLCKTCVKLVEHFYLLKFMTGENLFLVQVCFLHGVWFFWYVFAISMRRFRQPLCFAKAALRCTAQRSLTFYDFPCPCHNNMIKITTQHPCLFITWRRQRRWRCWWYWWRRFKTGQGDF